MERDYERIDRHLSNKLLMQLYRSIGSIGLSSGVNALTNQGPTIHCSFC